MELVIFTDLDGSLISAVDYCYTPVLPVLKELQHRNIPLIYVSSKTSAEIQHYQTITENFNPFVCENGAAIYIPSGYFKGVKPDRTTSKWQIIELGPNLNEIQELSKTLQEAFSSQIRFLSHLPLAEVIADTGLSPQLAALVKERQYDCPVKLSSPNPHLLDNISSLAQKLGFTIVAGSRYYHFLKNNDKGKAIKILKELYEKKLGEITTAAVGDSSNDLAMLAEVDYPLLVQKADSSFISEISLKNLHYIPEIGPEGWKTGISELLRRFSPRPLILASASPRRYEILKKAGFNFKVAASHIEENCPLNATPLNTALYLAELKAQTVAKDYLEQWVIGADTIVVINGEILGKPKDKNDALTMLSKLNNQEHQVITAVSLLKQQQLYSFSETSQVTFKNNSSSTLEAYVETGEPLDKAGAYAIQGLGGQLINSISGDLNNIIGFPLTMFIEYYYRYCSK